MNIKEFVTEVRTTRSAAFEIGRWAVWVSWFGVRHMRSRHCWGITTGRYPTIYFGVGKLAWGPRQPRASDYHEKGDTGWP